MKWLMRINQPIKLTASEVTDSLFSDILFTTVEFRSIYNQALDQREYQYKPFNRWETYLKVPAEYYVRGTQFQRYIVLEAYIPKYFARERYYKVERIN